MDKLIVLQSFEKRAETILAREEMQVYLLLLAACDDNGSGRLGWDSARRALGESLTRPCLERMCRNLAECGFLESVYFDKFPAEDAKAEPFIAYQLRLPD